MKNLLNKLLKYYEKEDFALKLKAQFVLVFTFITIITIFLTSIFSNTGNIFSFFIPVSYRHICINTDNN